jgi:hypothetical protein
MKRILALLLGAGLFAGVGRAQTNSSLVVITQQPISQVFYQGAAAQLLVGAQGATPLSYQWANGGTNLAGATNALLYFSAISTNDAGVYSVVVTNSFNSATSTLATLTIYPLDPTNLVSIIQQPPDLVVYEGSVVSLQVGVAGTAPFYYQWLKNGTNLDNQIAAQLYFAAVTTNDTGVYTVAVTNSYNGLISTPATLTVVPLTSRKLRLAGYETPAAGRIVVPVQLAALGAENSVAFTLAFDPTVLANAVAVSPVNLANTNAVLAPTNQVVGTNIVQLSTDTSLLSQGLLGLKVALPAGWQFTATTNRVIEVGFDLLPGASPFNARLGLGDSPVAIAIVDVTGTNQPVNSVLLPVILPVANAPTLDPTIGLFLQKLTLVNPYNTNLVGGGVVVRGLGNDSLGLPIVVTNATFNDTNSGVFLATGAVVPGATVEFTVEFYVADRTTVPQPVYESAATVFYPPFSILYSVRIKADYFAYEAAHPLVEFFTRTNYNYYLQYLDDLGSTNGWLTSLPVVAGKDRRVQWYDTGVPRTTPRGSVRFYRVIQYP